MKSKKLGGGARLHFAMDQVVALVLIHNPKLTYLPVVDGIFDKVASRSFLFKWP